MARARRKEGSWWPEWLSWLQTKAGSGAPVRPPVPQEILGPAPGIYVLET
jgi:polyhydroxyalkanoate synthase